MSAARIEAVCVVYALRDTGLRRVPVTGIDKRPVDGPVHVGEIGLAGDRQCDTANHGGLYKAVYAYGEHEADRWGTELGRQLAAGWFGENLRVSGPSPTDAVIGERWRIGDGGLLLEVTGPRTPCRTFVNWSGEPDWAARFIARGDTGAYLKVVSEGPVRAGDVLTVEDVPEHGATVRDVYTGSNPERIVAMLEQQADLAQTVADQARRQVTGRKARVES